MCHLCKDVYTQLINVPGIDDYHRQLLSVMELILSGSGRTSATVPSLPNCHLFARGPRKQQMSSALGDKQRRGYTGIHTIG